MSSNRGRRILFVHGLTADTRARDLAREFERYGPIVRCDVPPPRPGSDPRSVYAFVEYEHSRDAEDAYDRLHEKRFGEGRIRIQWAKRGPEPAHRRRDNERRGRSRSRSRSRSPLRERRGRSHSRRSQSKSPSAASANPTVSADLADPASPANPPSVTAMSD